MHNISPQAGPAAKSILFSRLSFQQIKASAKTFLALLVGASALGAAATAQTAGAYQTSNIISDGSVTATTMDAQFINPWGVSVGPAFWINTQATGLDYVSTATGTIPFKVTIPAASGTGTGSPTGTVFNSGTGFVLPNGTAATFLFATLDGTLSGWNAGLGTAGSVAQIAVNNSGAGADYTDISLLTNSTGTFLLAANFGAGNDIEVYNQNFAIAKLSGNFTDPNLPANYSPFAVHVLDSQVFVTYALRATAMSATGSNTYAQTVGAGNGIVDVYDMNGNFVARAVTGGNLNAPWGVAIAPTGFGVFGGDLLVGNFGDGIINAYNPMTYAFVGQLTDGTGKALSFASLWEIVFGESDATPAGAGDPNTLYIAAGLANGAHGLFAGIANTTAATGAATFGFSASTSTATVMAGSSTTATISVAPTNSFSGTVNLSCTGPAGVTCTFSPSSLSVTPTAPVTSTVTIQTTASMAHLEHNPWTGRAGMIAAAFLMPFGSILVFTRRRTFSKRNPLQFLGVAILLLASTGLAVGCSGSSTMMPAATTPPVSTPMPPATPGTPTGMQMVTITATSGSLMQNTTIALTVQ